MSKFLELIATVLSNYQSPNKLCIAYSGGVDSHALLHALVQLRDANFECNVRAVHVNHGISQFASEWQLHCEQVCQQLNVPLKTYQLKVEKSPGESLEAQAREARYHCLSETLQKDEVLVTGHNADDQAETLLLQLLRGSGVMGLAAMPVKKPFSQSNLLRPLLGITRKQIEAFALENQLQWIEDESNQDTAFDRNYLRHRITPVVAERWPHFAKSFSRSAENCAEAMVLMREVASQDLQRVMTADKALAISELKQLSVVRQHNLVRHWIQHQGFELPSKQQLHAIDSMVIAASADSMPALRWGLQVIRRYQNKLYITHHTDFCFASYEDSWDLSNKYILPAGLGTVTVEELSQQLDFKKIEGEVVVRFRRGGERIMPQGRKETHQLKKLMQEWQVPPWQREQIPLLFYQGELIAVIGFCVAAQFALIMR